MAKGSKVVIKAIEDLLEGEVKENIYWNGSCVTRYWIWNEEHNCISYGKMESKVMDQIIKEKMKEKQ